jgi:hypothetical protein
MNPYTKATARVSLALLVLLPACLGDEDAPVPGAPEITVDAAPRGATALEQYIALVTCVDPLGGVVVMALGEDDTCRGTLGVVSEAQGAFEYVFTPPVDAGDGACVIHLVCTDASGDAGWTHEVSIAPSEEPPLENAAPALTLAPALPEAVAPWEVIRVDLRCEDPDGDAVTLGMDEEAETCGGEVIDPPAPGLVYELELGPDTAGTSCVIALACSDGRDTTRFAHTLTVHPLGDDVAALDFGPFAAWAAPIEDYREANTEILGHADFRAWIDDLVVFQDRLYLGYGDADLNLGRNTPIELRYFERVDPEGVRADQTTDEEEISRFRLLGDQLVIPGVDATEDDLLGNVYLLDSDGGWTKSRSCELGWHVHDVARLGDRLFAGGSGGTLDDYSASTVNALLWVSEDGGQTFTVAEQVPHPAPPGDQRVTDLLAIGETLYVFGYVTIDGVASPQAFARAADAWMAPWDGLPAFFVLDSQPLDAARGLLVGVAIGDPLRQAVMRLDEGGPAEVAALTGKTALDISPLGDGRALVMWSAGDAYPLTAPDHAPLEASVGLLDADLQLLPLAAGVFPARPVSVALWRQRLFVGLADGTIQVSAGAGSN